MTKHEFHLKIRRLLSECLSPPWQWYWDEACGGTSRISFFRENVKCSASRYACPDGVLLCDSDIRLILEIEEVGENGFTPQRITGKLLPIALSRHCIERDGTAAAPLRKPVTFIHVLNNEGLQPRSRKLRQYAFLEADIRRLLPLSFIDDYRMISGTPDQFDAGVQRTQLLRAVTAVTERSGE